MYSIRYDLPSTYNLLRIGEDLYKLHASILILILLFQFVFSMYKINLNEICLNQNQSSP